VGTFGTAIKYAAPAARFMANQPEHEVHEEHEQHEQREPMGPREPNTIYVGKKPTMNYVLACLTQINNGSNVVTVKARGRAISRAVDVAQVLTKRFATDIKVQGITINTEQVKSTMTGGMSNVSSIEIKLGK
jgi:archaea-specific DNA-binding protein